MRRVIDAALSAFQILTRIPVPAPRWSDDLGGRAAVFFPVVGLVVGGGAALVNWLCRRLGNQSLRALAVLIFLVLITGGLHEDGLADTADGLGGGHGREQILRIMRDSRIGSFGVIALTLSLLARFTLLTALPASRGTAYLIATHVLCRWAALPLAAYLPSARGNDGQGAKITLHIPAYAVPIGTLIAAGIAIGMLRRRALVPLLVTIAITAASGWYYRRRIGGVTGDCMGATIQITEIALYICAVLAPV